MPRVTALILLLGLASAHAQGPEEVGERDVHREYGYLSMRDGVRLAYVVWRPKKGKRYPTLLTYSPYGSGGMPLPKGYLREGYAVVGADIRGTGCSEGAFDPYNIAVEGADGAALVEWAAAQRWSTGNVGMVGNSYSGGSQLRVAVHRPPHLRAIVSSAASASVYRTFAMVGGMMQTGATAEWSLDGQPGYARRGAQTRIRQGDPECTAIRAKQPPNRFYYDVRQHPLLDEWWKQRSVENFAGEIAVPALLMGTWQDPWNVPDVMPLFNLLGSAHKMLIMQNGAHGGAQSAPERMRWLARWVKGERNGVETAAPVLIRWEQSPKGPSGWTTRYPRWPAPDLRPTTFYLTAEGKLAADRAAIERPGGSGVRWYVYPHGSEIVGNDVQFATPPPPLGSLSYETEPMAEDTALLGAPTLTFYFSSEQTDTDFMFTLKDIDAAGDVLFLQRNFLRASLRALDAERTAAYGEAVQSYDKVEKLEPGKVYELTVSLGAIGHLVRQGHRLQITLLAPGASTNVMGTAPIGGPSLNKVYHSARYPSAVVLPILPGEKARKPAPPCGSLPVQPCRHATGAPK